MAAVPFSQLVPQELTPRDYDSLLSCGHYAGQILSYSNASTLKPTREPTRCQSGNPASVCPYGHKLIVHPHGDSFLSLWHPLLLLPLLFPFPILNS